MQEVTLDGVQTARSHRRPPRWPLSALHSGLVLQARTLELCDPATGRITQKLPGVFPVAAANDWRLISYAPGCRALHITDTLTGAWTMIRPRRDPRFTETYGGAFSPDGRLVATTARYRQEIPRVAIVDLAHHSATWCAARVWGATMS